MSLIERVVVMWHIIETSKPALNKFKIFPLQPDCREKQNRRGFFDKVGLPSYHNTITPEIYMAEIKYKEMRRHKEGKFLARR